MNTYTQLFGEIAAIGSAFSWAVGSVLYKKIGEQVAAPALNLLKGIISLCLLSLAILFFDPHFNADPSSLILLGISGILGITIGDTLFFIALQHLGAYALVSLTMLGQVLTVIIAVLFLRESPSLVSWIGIVLILSGVFTVLYSRTQAGYTKSTSRGILFGLLSVAAMTAGIIVAKKGLTGISALHATFIRMLFGVAGVAVWGIVSRQFGAWTGPLGNGKLIKDVSAAVCVSTLGGFYLFHVAIKYVDVSIANTLNATEPLFVLPFAVFMLKEKVVWQSVAGMIAASGGVVCIIQGMK